jgi:hypothetical protein
MGLCKVNLTPFLTKINDKIDFISEYLKKRWVEVRQPAQPTELQLNARPVSPKSCFEPFYCTTFDYFYLLLIIFHH